MVPNLVSLVMQFLTPDMIGRLASALGLDRNKLQPAIGAAVPGLLAGLSGVALQPGGPQKLVEAAKQNTGTPGNFATMLGAGAQTSFVEKGSQMLSSLLGGREQNGLVGALAKFAGLGEGASGSLLGMLAPLVMGTIAQQQGPRSLDASSVAGMLTSQKDNIATALPAGFRNLLGGTGVLDSLGGAARTATASGSGAARSVAPEARAWANTGYRAAAAASTPLNWLYWLIPALAVVALLIYLFARPSVPVVPAGVDATQGLRVDGLDVGKQVTDSITSLRTALAGITDTASAQAAVPKLQEVTGQIDRVDGLLGQLSPEQRKVLAGTVNPSMPTLNELFDKVLAIPGVAELLKPTIEALRAKLAMLLAA